MMHMNQGMMSKSLMCSLGISFESTDAKVSSLAFNSAKSSYDYFKLQPLINQKIICRDGKEDSRKWTKLRESSSARLSKWTSQTENPNYVKNMEVLCVTPKAKGLLTKLLIDFFVNLNEISCFIF